MDGPYRKGKEILNIEQLIFDTKKYKKVYFQGWELSYKRRLQQHFKVKMPLPPAEHFVEKFTKNGYCLSAYGYGKTDDDYTMHAASPSGRVVRLGRKNYYFTPPYQQDEFDYEVIEGFESLAEGFKKNIYLAPEHFYSGDPEKNWNLHIYEGIPKEYDDEREDDAPILSLQSRQGKLTYYTMAFGWQQLRKNVTISLDVLSVLLKD